MKKKFVVAFVLLMLAILYSKSFAFADLGYINLTLNQTKEISPDIAEIIISVETSNKSSKIATEENKKISTNVQAKVKTLLNEQSGDYIKTSEFRLNPKYSYKDGKSIFEAYSVTNSITVNTKNLEIVSKIIDTAIKEGATNVSNLNFKVSDYDDVCSVMLSDLAKKSKQQAQKIATPMGAKVKGIRSLETRCNVEGEYPRVMYSMNMAKDASGTASTPINKGKIKVNATLEASYFVK